MAQEGWIWKGNTVTLLLTIKTVLLDVSHEAYLWSCWNCKEKRNRSVICLSFLPGRGNCRDPMTLNSCAARRNWTGSHAPVTVSSCSEKLQLLDDCYTCAVLCCEACVPPTIPVVDHEDVAIIGSSCVTSRGQMYGNNSCTNPCVHVPVWWVGGEEKLL